MSMDKLAPVSCIWDRGLDISLRFGPYSGRREVYVILTARKMHDVMVEFMASCCATYDMLLCYVTVERESTDSQLVSQNSGAGQGRPELPPNRLSIGAFLA